MMHSAQSLSRSLLAFILCTFLLVSDAEAQEKGVVYVIYGSDTAIWDGMDTGKRHPTYNLSLFTSPSGNAARIMSEEFRNQVLDSYGQPLVMTWWMMAGNIFRDGTNTNVPYRNLMTLHLIKKYHRQALERWGDELSLHYHTFFWSDYDGDGRYWWNQAKTFEESRDDFDFTLAQQLIEENVFPVSFRSGWHFMDNTWQQRLDELLPYSMHDAYPSKKTVDTEPLDNVIDWSRAPSAWVPWHPDPNDYQVPGPGRGWNLRSISMGGTTRAKVEPAFIEAAAGRDQILCIWDHLPDANFFSYLLQANGILHTLATDYPGVKFRFVRGADGMKQFLGFADSTAPELSVAFEGTAPQTTIRVTSTEPLFQPIPFIALKTLGEDYIQLPCEQVSALEWRTSVAVDTSQAAKVSIAVTDTVGNLTTWSYAFAPDPLFIDDESPSYAELRGAWTTKSSPTWGTTSRVTAVPSGDSSMVSWSAIVPASRPYAIRMQLPVNEHACRSYRLHFSGGSAVLLDSLTGPLLQGVWLDAGVFDLQQGDVAMLELTGYAEAGSVTTEMEVDVIQMTPLVPAYKMTTGVQDVSIGYASLGDTLTVTIPVRNLGRTSGTLIAMGGGHLHLTAATSLPMVVAPGASIDAQFEWVADQVGTVTDTVIFEFMESSLLPLRVPVGATIERAIRLVDNDEGVGYSEGGVWKNSVVTSYGPTSRFSNLSPGGGQYAEFRTRIPEDGYYRISFLIPSSENATDHALHTIREGTRLLDSLYLTQRPGGTWTYVGIYHFSADSDAVVRVSNVGGYTSGLVLRAAAMKFVMVSLTPTTVYLADNDSVGVYQEIGTWFTSNAQASGASSRYCWLQDGPGQRAQFGFSVWDDGQYILEYIVPTTVNATHDALYTISQSGVLIDSVRRDQSANSGGWVSLGEYELKAFQRVTVEVINDQSSTAALVLRADAVRARKVVTTADGGSRNAIPGSFALDPVFPNPFNATATIRFILPREEDTRLVIHDLLGREKNAPPEVIARLFCAAILRSAALAVFRFRCGMPGV